MAKFPYKVYEAAAFKGEKKSSREMIAACADAMDAARIALWQAGRVVKADGRKVYTSDNVLATTLHNKLVYDVAMEIDRRRANNWHDSKRRFDEACAKAEARRNETKS
jgi:hypothetical protein